MVVREHGDITIEVPATQMPRRERKKFLVVNNHVREIPIVKESDLPKNELIAEESVTKNKRKKRNKAQTTSVPEEKQVTEISASDLSELRTVYLKCKEVVEKIESKYGHLLNLEETSTGRNKRKFEEIEQYASTSNKKIVFDDNGESTTVDNTNINHICAKKVKESPEHSNIQISYAETETQLPDSIPELQNLLRQPNLTNAYRYEIVCKIRVLRHEIGSEIKFNKPALIEKLKSNPDEVLEFKGSNLASIPGYL